MRLLFDCHTFDTEPQGTTTLLRGLLNALPAAFDRRGRGGELELFCASADGAALGRTLSVEFQHVPINTGFLQRNLWGIPMAAQRIHADIVISQYVRPIWVPNLSLSFIHDLLFMDFPNHFSWTYRTSRKALFGLSARTSTRILTISEYSKKRIVQAYGIDPDRISIMPCAGPKEEVFSNIQRYPPTNQESPSIHLLYIARLEPRKRQEWCIRLVQDLLNQGIDASLTLVGTGVGAYAEGVRKVVSDPPPSLKDRIRLAECISTDTLHDIIRIADIFIYPSLGEGFGIPVLEAAAAGLPCIVTDGTSLSELRPYFSGETFASDSYEEFLFSTSKVLRNMGEYILRAEVLRTTLGTTFSWERAADQFLEVALSAMGKHETIHNHS